MAARTTTGIVLAQSHRTGGYRITAPEKPAIELNADHSLSDCAAAAGLTNGYWLRDTSDLHVTRWTWVQL